MIVCKDIIQTVHHKREWSYHIMHNTAAMKSSVLTLGNTNCNEVFRKALKYVPIAHPLIQTFFLSCSLTFSSIFADF